MALPDYFRRAAPALAAHARALPAGVAGLADWQALALRAPVLCLLADRLLARFVADGWHLKATKFAQALADGDYPSALERLPDWLGRVRAGLQGRGGSASWPVEWDGVDASSLDPAIRVPMLVLHTLAADEDALRAHTRGMILRTAGRATLTRLVPRDGGAADAVAFSGRSPQLRRLDAIVAGLSANTPACLLLLTGMGGQGKSALLSAWAGRLADRAPAPLYPAVSGFASRRRWLRGCLRYPDPTRSVAGPLDVVLLDQISALMLEPCPRDPDTSLAGRRGALARALSALVDEQGPVVVLVDLPDDRSQGAEDVAALLPRAWPDGVAVVLAARDGEEARSLAAGQPDGHGLAHMALGPLDAASLGEVLGVEGHPDLWRLRTETGGWITCLADLARQRASGVALPDMRGRPPLGLLEALAGEAMVREDTRPLRELLCVLQPVGEVSPALLSGWFRFRVGREAPPSVLESWLGAGRQGGAPSAGTHRHARGSKAAWLLARFAPPGDPVALRQAFVSWLAREPGLLDEFAGLVPAFLADRALDAGALQVDQPLYDVLFERALASADGEELLHEVRRAAPRRLERALGRADGSASLAAGTLRLLGFGVDKGLVEDEELRILEQAAETAGGGHVLHLARFLAREVRPPGDRARARALWHSLARGADHGVAWRAAMDLAGSLLEQDAPARDKAEGIGLLMALDEAGHPQASLDLADHLIAGTAGPGGERQGRLRLRALARSGSLEAVGRLLQPAMGGADRAAARRCLRGLVASGHAEARRVLASRLIDGLGFRRSPVAGRALLEEAVQGGDVDAAVDLAGRLAIGDGLPAEGDRARALLQELADAGEPRPAALLAWWLLAGEGIPRDPREGLRLLRVLADDGDLGAERELVRYLRRGFQGEAGLRELRWRLGRLACEGDETDRHEAARCFLDELASPDDLARGWIILGELSDDGWSHAWSDQVARLMEGDGVPADPDRAMAMARSRAEAGHPAAARMLADYLMEGERVPRDPREAWRWLHALETLDADAAGRLRRRWFLAGHPGPDGTGDGWEGLHDAVGQGDAEAMLRLADRLLDGPGGPDDRRQGHDLLAGLAAQGHVEARGRLAMRLLRGRGLPADPGRALSLLSGLAGEGDEWASYALGRALLEGDGVPADPDRGRRWLSGLAEGGDEWFNRQARWALAKASLAGCWRTEDPGLGRRMLERLARGNKDARAKAVLASALMDGDHMPPDPEEGRRHLEEMANEGHAFAAIELGIRLFDGKGLARDPEAGVAWLGEPARLGHAGANLALGLRLLSDEPATSDPVGAVDCLRRLLAPGVEQAEQARLLGVMRRMPLPPEHPARTLDVSCLFAVPRAEASDDLLLQRALCRARGFAVDRNWDEAIGDIGAIRDPATVAGRWCRQGGGASDERDIILAWLADVHGYPDPDGLGLADRLELARGRGWHIPADRRRAARWGARA